MNFKFILLHTFCCLQHTLAIMNHPPTKDTNALSISKQLGNRYLNQQRPLWILDDRVQQSDYTELNYSRHIPQSYQMQQKQMQQQQTPTQLSAAQLTQMRQQNSATHRQAHAIAAAPQQHFTRATHFFRQRPQRTRMRKYTPRLLQRRQNYTPMRRSHLQQRLTRKQPRFINANAYVRAHRREHYIPHLNLPTFDSLPGDESLDATPIFIYTGPKGAIILNTMLSAHRYPMQEPVPGEVLYPPSVPIFRPKPIVERFRMPHSAQMLNLTLIPFYAHEAIEMPHASRMFNHDDVLSQESTTVQPTVLYASPAVVPPIADSANSESAPPTIKWRMKKGKHYSAYHSPNEVQWTPMSLDQLNVGTSTTTAFPLTAPSPPQNHRFTTDKVATSTMSPSFTNYKITYKSESDSLENADEKDALLVNDKQLGVIYVDDSLEKPIKSSTTPSKVSSRYTLSKEYYAFPVFTLGKLLKKEMVDTEKQLSTAMIENTVDNPLENEQVQREEHVTAQTFADSVNVAAEENGENDEDDVETWFILNSRYKGQRQQNSKEYRLSSKYIHTPDLREPNEVNS